VTLGHSETLRLVQTARRLGDGVAGRGPRSRPAIATRNLEEIRAVTKQLAPERARSCRDAITMAPVMVDEIRLRAHASPLDSDEE
jgi:hypothetical protein